jgi:hypothetical protein
LPTGLGFTEQQRSSPFLGGLAITFVLYFSWAFLFFPKYSLTLNRFTLAQLTTETMSKTIRDPPQPAGPLPQQANADRDQLSISPPKRGPANFLKALESANKRPKTTKKGSLKYVVSLATKVGRAE